MKEKGFYNMTFVADNPALYKIHNYSDRFDKFNIIGSFYRKRRNEDKKVFFWKTKS